MRIITTDQANFHGVKVLVYGPAGVGKTTLCATAPSPLILSAEAGLLSLRRVSLPVIEIKGVDDLTNVYSWLRSSSEAAQYHTICIDSISEIAEVILAHMKPQVKDPRQAYGEMLDRMLVTVKALRDLPGKHVYMSAKMEPYKDEISGAVMYGPSFPGQRLGPQLPYLFDEVFRMGVGKTQQGEEFRFLQTQPDLRYTAKDRSGSLEAAEPPDLGYVINKILGGI